MAAEATDKVCLAVLHGRDVSAAHYDAMLNFLMADAKGMQRVASTVEQAPSGRITTKWSASGGIATARNETVKRYMEMFACSVCHHPVTSKDPDKGDCEVCQAEVALYDPHPWFWWLDSDMLFDPMLVERLLATADAIDRPVVGALCFGQRATKLDPAATPNNSWFPTIYAFNPEQDRFVGLHDYPRQALMQVGGTGAACTIIHRSAFQRVRDEFGDCWYTPWDTRDGQHFGEDLSFCRRLLELEIPVHVNTGACAGHHKSDYGNEWSWHQESQHVPIVAVIPVKDKLHLTSALVTELLHQGDVDKVLVYDNGSTDDTRQWLTDHPDPRVLGVEADEENIHEMWNHGLMYAREEYGRACVLILNNDLEIGPNFGLQLRKALYSDWDIMAVSPNYDGRPGSDLIHVQDICAGRYDGTGGLAGFAFAVRAEWDYRFPPELQWWFGDNDLVTSINQRGYKAMIDPKVSVVHLDGGGQTGGDWSSLSEAIRSDREFFMKKWGIT